MLENHPHPGYPVSPSADWDQPHTFPCLCLSHCLFQTSPRSCLYVFPLSFLPYVAHRPAVVRLDLRLDLAQSLVPEQLPPAEASMLVRYVRFLGGDYTLFCGTLALCSTGRSVLLT